MRTHPRTRSFEYVQLHSADSYWLPLIAFTTIRSIAYRLPVLENHGQSETMETCTTEHVLAALKPNWHKDFPVVGQGTVIFNMQRSTPFCIVIRPKPKPIRDDDTPDDPCEWISLEVEKSAVRFKLHIDKKTTVVAKQHGEIKHGETKYREKVGYIEGRKVSYWFSYDRNLLILKYGKGYRMTETTIMEHDFLKDLTPDEQRAKREKLHRLFSPEIRRIIEQYDVEEEKKLCQVYQNKLLKGMTFGYDGKQMLVSSVGTAPPIHVHQGAPYAAAANLVQPCSLPVDLQEESAMIAKSMIDVEGKVDFDKNPFTCNWSPIVLDSSKNTLFELDSNNYTFSASLPSACRELYQNVVQEGVSIDWPPGLEQYKLSDAIRHSLEKGILHKRIEEKAREFGTYSPKKTYLRVTLGMDRGISPGIPYVLEIWPKGHSSPIHNHGNAYAVIKVLFGGLTIHVYNKHANSDSDKELFSFNVKKGDVTWISPNWYQTHMLKNCTNDYCATIQCYQYGENDNLHWPYFDYVKSTETIDEFLPNSDFTFREMREKVLKEYEEYMKSAKNK